MTLASTVVVTPHQVSCDLGGATAILNGKTGTYYRLDSIGSRIWQMIQEPIRIDTLATAIHAEYDVDRPHCEQDLLELLSKLQAEGLIYVA